MVIPVIVWLLQVLNPCEAGSQDFTSVNLDTYHLYLERKWDELIRTGKEGLKNNVDYYYLRMRLGIAYYEKRNYKASQVHFRKALEFNAGDPVAMEYLYFAYLLAGQSRQARLVAREFTPSLVEKINPAPAKFADMLSVEYLHHFTDSEHILSDPEDHFSGLPPGYQVITRNYSNLNLMLHHGFSPGFTLTHAFTRLAKSNFYYSDDGLSRFAVDGQKVVQHQYYVSPAFSTSRGWVISPAFHYLRIRYQVPYMVSGGTGPGFGGGTGTAIRYTDRKGSQYVGGLNISRYAGRFAVRLGGIYSWINDEEQLTGTGGLTWYPLGNLDLYLNANLNAHIEFTEQGTEVGLIPDLLLGFGISSRVWMEFSGAYGTMRNYTEGNGYIVYNGLDWMRYKIMGSIVIPLTTKGSRIYLGGRFSEYESSFIPLDPQGARYSNIMITNSISIYGGLLWTF